jgi:hypothetical protein
VDTGQKRNESFLSPTRAASIVSMNETMSILANNVKIVNSTRPHIQEVKLKKIEE